MFAHVVTAGLEEMRQLLQLETVDRFGLENIRLVQLVLQQLDLRFDRLHVDRHFFQLFRTVIVVVFKHVDDSVGDFLFQNFQIDASDSVWIKRFVREGRVSGISWSVRLDSVCSVTELQFVDIRILANKIDKA